MSLFHTVMTTLKAKAPVGLALAASLAAVSFVNPAQQAYADPAAQQAFNQFVANMGTTQLGTNAQFASILPMSGLQTITLSWKTTTPNTVSGHFTVTNKQSGGPSLIDGYVNAPGAGQVGQFSIDFTKLPAVQQQAHNAPQNLYVTIQPVNAAHKGLAPQSNAVTITWAYP